MPRAPGTKARRRAAGPPACVLVSGGVDSIVLLRETLKRHKSVQPLYVRAGMAWEPVERRALARLLRLLRGSRLRPLRTIDVPMGDLLARHWSATGRDGPGYDDGDASVFIPGRNIALFSKAATFCTLERIPVLVSGILSANPFPDGSPRFLRAMERGLALGLGARFRIATPFRRRTKDEVIRLGRDLPLHLTFSCISPRRGLHCGDCCKCKERIDAFVAAGVADRTRYARPAPASSGGAGSVPRGRPARSASAGGATARIMTRQAAKSATSAR
ncbi:MAG TPA: 7-cyano-7-deazaguanine synthase [Candidatus Polarisedimenticolia bacterium]|nr:7-cyano-7-deazaguanine synthase [Candidatus Polarisedimenticolia bacterium]